MYLNNHKSDEIKDYINELVKFSYNRKFEFSNYTKKTKESFKFDFIKASNSNYKINPADIRLKNNKKEIEFYYSESALDDLQYAIKSFGVHSVNTVSLSGCE